MSYYNCPPKNEINKLYGLWKVIEKAKQPKGLKNQGAYWLCECQCDLKTKKVIRGGTLRQGLSTNCGCNKLFKSKQPRKIDAPFLSVLRKIKASANKRNLEFSLTIENIKSIVTKNCYYCDTLPSNVDSKLVKTHNFYFSGIDRIDNNIGYHYNNCVPCCNFCNTAKLTKNQNEFFQHVKKIYIKHCQYL